MSAQRASAPVRLARTAAAVLILALAAVIAVRLAGRRGVPPAPAPAPPPPEGRVVDVKERVRHQEYKDGRPVVDIRGASLSRGADGRNRLSGPVEVLNLGPSGETVSRLTADEVVYDPGSLLFAVSGRVRVEAEGMTLEGDSFSYDKERGLFATTSGGRFASEKVRGRASRISYRESAGEIRLGGGFRLEIAADGGQDGATAVSGESLVLDRRERRGRINGRASIAGAGFRSSSGTAVFVVAPDGSSLESADLQGVPRLALIGKDGSGEGGGKISAGRIAVTFGREPSGLAILASCHSILSFRSGPEKEVTVLSSELLLNVSRDDMRSTWTASGGVRAEIAGTGSDSRALEGREAAFDDAKVLHVTGAAGRPAVADSGEVRIEAPRIAVASGTGDVLASGGVACVLKKGDGRRTVGFFSSLEDVLVSSDRLETVTEGLISLFSGNVQVRQGEDSLRAGELEIAGSAGRMTGAQGIEAVLTEAPTAGKPGRTVELGGRDMTYSPASRTLVLTVKAFVRLPDAGLEAETVSAVIGRGGRSVETLAAAKAVAVSRGRYTGRSEAASYEAATGRLTLTGKPVLTDDKGGSARGATLTFSLSDDKIFIENEGSGRATTVVRS